jgi:hypothetical protein
LLLFQILPLQRVVGVEGKQDKKGNTCCASHIIGWINQGKNLCNQDAQKKQKLCVFRIFEVVFLIK